MRQFTYLLNNVSDYEMACEEVGQTLRCMHVSCISAAIFCTEEYLYQARDLAKRMQADFPEAQVVGSVTERFILDGASYDRGVSLTFNIFERSRVESFAYATATMSVEDMGRDLLERLQRTKAPKAVALSIAGAGLGYDLTPLLKMASEAAPEVNFFGGLADDSSVGKKGVMFNAFSMLDAGLGGCIFSGEELEVECLSNFGWRPLGRFMTITELETPYIITRIDGQPAAKVYEHYLDVAADQHFIKNSLTFPFYLERSGQVLARHPLALRSDGALVFGADFQEGERVHLAYGDPAGIVRNARKLHREMARFRPQGILSVSCVARSMLMGSDVKHELSGCMGLAPMNGYYAYGEVIRHEGEVMLANMTLELVGMREGKAAEGEALPLPPPEDFELSDQTNIMRHLVRFISVTSAELEAVNARLQVRAQTDYLTSLLNRSELERMLKYNLNYAKETGRPVSVLMLDVDDFKGINDKYGHDIGDRALQLAAETLRRHTRKHDSPGRWGGDEFFVVLRDTTAEEAARLGERIRRAMSRADVLPDHKHLTTSIGVTEALPGDTPQSLFKRVDEALYLAKQEHGKNNVCMVTE